MFLLKVTNRNHWLFCFVDCSTATRYPQNLSQKLPTLQPPGPQQLRGGGGQDQELRPPRHGGEAAARPARSRHPRGARLRLQVTSGQ